ncbi:MAG TPA: M15 family metallopeptidase [Clostridiales bacterium]|nr:M15 family metallopeptidase [Clostridiales bacterium]
MDNDITRSKVFYTDIKQVLKPDCLDVLVNKFYKLPQDYVPRDLEPVNSDYSDGNHLLRHEARLALEIMGKGALEEGISIKACSAFRSYDYQEEVYLRKKTDMVSLEEYQIERDRVSARPGHSEHQTGLAVDINETEQTFEDTPAGRWLAGNSYRYGYILRYPKGKEHITGYDYEPWHYRYVGNELAHKVYNSGLTYDEYYEIYLQ